MLGCFYSFMRSLTPDTDDKVSFEDFERFQEVFLEWKKSPKLVDTMMRQLPPEARPILENMVSQDKVGANMETWMKALFSQQT